ncbi:hypothetical protein IAU60_001560 [Kwoniella sp. DSM 27419]
MSASARGRPPQPASHTKHIAELDHPLPRDLSTRLSIRQISSTTSGPDRVSQVTPVPAPAHAPTLTAASDPRPYSRSVAPTGSASTGTTGTTLWLSAQILSLYLSSLPGPTSGSSSRAVRVDTGVGANDTDKSKGQGSGRSNKVLELGGGTGYTALTLASQGWDVTTTDIEPVLSSVLRYNTTRGEDALRSGRKLPPGAGVRARYLDWAETSLLWADRAVPAEPVPDDTARQTPTPLHDPIPDRHTHQGPRGEYTWLTGQAWDMIVMTDTFYAPHLIDPLWQTLLLVSHPAPPDGAITVDFSNDYGTRRTESQIESLQGRQIPQGRRQRTRSPPIYIALERRDPRLMTSALDRGRELGFDLKKIARPRLSKELERAGWGWQMDDWEDVEVWKCRFAG